MPSRFFPGSRSHPETNLRFGNRSCESGRTYRLGLAEAHPAGLWEMRAGLSLRAIFRLDKDEAIFLFLGNHDEVKRFLNSL
jgi:hypothetical protein